jgi:hypothetical protein
MLLQPFPAHTHSPDEKVEPLTWRTSAQDFRFIPLGDLAPGFGPPCPWLDMDYCYCTTTAETRDYAYPRPGHALHRREEAATTGERPNFSQSCSFRAFFRLRLRANASFTRFFSPGFR